MRFEGRFPAVLPALLTIATATACVAGVSFANSGGGTVPPVWASDLGVGWYGGLAFSEGSTICQLGEKYRFTAGSWVPLGTPCSGHCEAATSKSTKASSSMKDSIARDGVVPAGARTLGLEAHATTPEPK